jgi:hypothetical protein
MHTDNDGVDEPLSEDPEENLRLENQLLHLKLKAELGAESQSFEGVPPEIENEFLKNVLAFEHASANAKQVTLYEYLGEPPFTAASELDNEAIETALEEIEAFLGEKNIAADFIAEYDSRTKYTFITEELFGHEVDDFMLPGMVMHFTYEEFHPNHKMDIENRAKRFLDDWFEQKFNEYSSELAYTFILPDGRTLKKTEVLEKFQYFFDSYTAFTDYDYTIADMAFELQGENGMGYAQGFLKYNAVLESNETITIEGPFKLYFALEYECWSIFYFVFPGWGW